MGDERQDSRRYPRVVVGDKTRGQVHDIQRGSVLNFSMGGALLEHTHTVRPGTILDLVLNLPQRETRVRCRVVWSAAHRAHVQPEGGEELVYRTGVEFLRRSAETP